MSIRILPALHTGLCAAALLLVGCATPEPTPEKSEEAAKPRFRASPYRIDDPDAPVITEENILENERFWPYRVGVTKVFRAEGAEYEVPRNRVGVMIRVEPSGNPRIDFGWMGKYEVPIEITDLVERANEIRLGERDKWGPNLTHAVRTRLVDTSVTPPASLAQHRVADRQGFLCVFADPAEEGFDDIARALAPLNERHGVMTVLFPLGRHPDTQVFDQLRELDWQVPFVWGFLAESFVDGFLVDAEQVPSVMLQTNEGRVLFFDRFEPEIVPALAARLDEAFGQVASK